MAIDLPGHGMSSHRPPGSLYSVMEYIADIKYVIDGECSYYVHKFIYVHDTCTCTLKMFVHNTAVSLDIHVAHEAFLRRAIIYMYMYATSFFHSSEVGKVFFPSSFNG